MNNNQDNLQFKLNLNYLNLNFYQNTFYNTKF
jgi:hypothetical protein